MIDAGKTLQELAEMRDRGEITHKEYEDTHWYMYHVAEVEPTEEKRGCLPVSRRPVRDTLLGLALMVLSFGLLRFVASLGQ